MPAPTDRNARIALAKGWTWHKHDFFLAPDFGNVPELRTHWLDPDSEPAMLPDYLGTLEGVDMMLWELGPVWSVRRFQNKWMCYHTFGPLVLAESFLSDKLGDCVGDAWLSVFEKEAADAS